MPAPGAAGGAAARVLVRRVDSASADSPDRGSCRVRLPASCGLPYHKPVIVTLRSLGGSEQPWRLLCVTAIAHDDVLDVASRSGSSSSSSSSINSSGGASSAQSLVDRAVLDATIVLPPPGRQPWEVHAALAAATATAASSGAMSATLSQQEAVASTSSVVADASQLAAAAAAAVVTPCPGTNTVPVAAEVQLRLVGQQQTAAAAAAAASAGSLPASVGAAAASGALWDTQAALSERLPFKLHQALVLPGCYVRLSDTVAVQVVRLAPAPPAPDCPARIVPSTRLVFTADGSGAAVAAPGQTLVPAAAAAAAGTDAGTAGAATATAGVGCESSEAPSAPGRTGDGAAAGAGAAAGGAPAKKKAASSKTAKAGKEEGGSGAGSSNAPGRSKKGSGAAGQAPGDEAVGGAGSAGDASGTAAVATETGAVSAMACEVEPEAVVKPGAAAAKPKKKKKEGSGSKASKPHTHPCFAATAQLQPSPSPKPASPSPSPGPSLQQDSLGPTPSAAPTLDTAYEDYSDLLEELVNSLPRPSATAAAATAFERAGLEAPAARYCATLGASLDLLHNGLMPSLNRTLNASVGGTPARSRRAGLVVAAVPHCRTLQSLFPWLYQALGDGGLSTGCYRATFNSSSSSTDPGLVLSPVANVGLLQLGRAVAGGLMQLSIGFCNGEVPGDWGQPYGSEFYFAYSFATAVIRGDDGGSGGGGSDASPPADSYDWWSTASPPPPPSLYDNGYGYNNGYGNSGWYYDPYYGWTYGRRRLLSVLEEDAASGRERGLLAVDSYGNTGGGFGRRRLLLHGDDLPAADAAEDGDGDEVEGLDVFARAMRAEVASGRAAADDDHKQQAGGRGNGLLRQPAEGDASAGGGLSGLLRHLLSDLGLAAATDGVGSSGTGEWQGPQAAEAFGGARRRGRRLMQTGANLRVALTNSSTDSSGRLVRGRPEAAVEPNGTLGSICDDAFSAGSAAVICRQLGYGGGGLAYAGAVFGVATRPYILDQLNCTGRESNLGQCPSNPLGVNDCFANEAAGVVCFPAFNVSYYCADVTANISRFYPTITPTSPDPSSWSRQQRLDRCGQLLGLASSASTLVGYKFPGQFMSYREVTSYACGREDVVPAVTAWAAAWRREVVASGCRELIVPFLWMQRFGGGALPSAPSPPPSSIDRGTVRRPPPPPLPPAPPARTNDRCPTAVAVWPTVADRAAADAAAPYGTAAVPAPATYMILDYVSAQNASGSVLNSNSSGTSSGNTSPLDLTCTPPTAWLAAGGAPNRRTRRSVSSSTSGARGPSPSPSSAPTPAPSPSFRGPPPPYRSGGSNSTFNSSYYYTSYISGAARRLFRRSLFDSTAAATSAHSSMLAAAAHSSSWLFRRALADDGAGAPAPPPPPPPPPPPSAAFVPYGASSAMWASASSAFAGMWSPRDLVNVSSLTRTLARGGPSWLPSRLSDRRHLLATLESFSRPGGIDLVSSGILDTVRWALASLPSAAPPPDANRPPRPPSPPPFRWTGGNDDKEAAAADPAPPRPPLRNGGGGGASSPPPPAPPSPPSPPPPGPRAATRPLAAAMPLKPTCVAYDSSWSEAEGFRSGSRLLDFLASNAASADGDWDGWGQQVAQTETELLYCNARQELQSRHTMSGIAITGLGLSGDAASSVRTLLRGARPFNDSGSSGDDDASSAAAAIAAANLAFLDLSGNTLTGGVPAIPVPVLHVNLSSNRLSGNLRAQLTTNLTAAAFTATLVLDLSNNRFTGQLPSIGDAVATPAATAAGSDTAKTSSANAWISLLNSAVRIDFSGNDLSGTLPADWAPFLAKMDLVVTRNPGLTGGVPEAWIAAARGLAPYGDSGSGSASAAGAAASPPRPPSPPAPAPGAPPAAGNPPRQGALLIDLSGCSGLSGRFSHTADYSTLRVRGTELMLDWKKLPAAERNWTYVVDRVARGHMDFEQVAYRKTGISNVLTKARLLDPDEVMDVCDAIDGLRNTERRAAVSSSSSSSNSGSSSTGTNGGSAAGGGDGVVVVAATEPWPRVRKYLEVHDSYTDWQTDPAVWCYGGAEARGIVALKVWLPVIIISVLACGLALPAHQLRAHFRRRAAARAAAWQRQQQQNAAAAAAAAAAESKDGKKKRPEVNRLGAPEGRLARAWRRTKEVMTPVIEIVEPRLILALYWVDLISDIVFIAGYKGWGRQPAPAIAVIIILLANLTAGWVLHLVHLRQHFGDGAAGGEGWSVARCVVVGILTAPFGIALEWLWNGFLALVTFVATVPALAKGDRKAHVTAVQRITRNWPLLLSYEGNIKIFEQTVLLEPVNESLPQAIVQTTCYVVGRNAGMVILTPIFLFSAILQAISICKSCLVLAWRAYQAGSWVEVITLRDEGHAKTFSKTDEEHEDGDGGDGKQKGKQKQGSSDGGEGEGEDGGGSDGLGGAFESGAGGKGGGKRDRPSRHTTSSSLTGFSSTLTAMSSGALQAAGGGPPPPLPFAPPPPPPPTDAQLAAFAGVPAFLYQQQQLMQQQQVQAPPPAVVMAAPAPGPQPPPPPPPLVPLVLFPTAPPPPPLQLSAFQQPLPFPPPAAPQQLMAAPGTGATAWGMRDWASLAAAASATSAPEAPHDEEFVDAEAASASEAAPLQADEAAAAAVGPAVTEQDVTLQFPAATTPPYTTPGGGASAPQQLAVRQPQQPMGPMQQMQQQTPQVLQPPQPAAAAFGFSPLTAHLQGWRAPAVAPAAAAAGAASPPAGGFTTWGAAGGVTDAEGGDKSGGALKGVWSAMRGLRRDRK
ncbi:hypothetical protein HYH02_009226 [Chlamydomonas schloesseri]|uniref:SRCR domain-containing protein n=1 Tax=Chlamydomonas schloesseri TaxID=2026947 RepID=A0A835WB11_9CHLO|nr:hypothetical protein HYH02_009226 [Chlamydomonas schloesseri]|eukprot:KAG2444027.1 hypothetical protein HYH02_009226 [Chlamydomonas schloesseri]